MRIEIKYFAFDGTEFDNEQECKDYEEHLLYFFSGVKFFDKNRNLIHEPKIEQIETETMYMFIVDKLRAVNLFHWLEENASFEPVKCEFSTEDIIYWNIEHSRWSNLTVEYRVFKTKLDAILARAKGTGK